MSLIPKGKASSISDDVISTSVFHLPRKVSLLDRSKREQENVGRSKRKIVYYEKMTAKTRAGNALKDVLLKYGCEYVGIGNGVGSEETVELLSNVIKTGSLKGLKVKHRIVREDAASYYSVTKLADEELPGVPMIARGAVSIARRLQYPLAELIKMDPKHIGAGRYQHDIDTDVLRDCLNSVVAECVKDVGVDLNTCSLELLKRVSGFNETIAKQILSERMAKRSSGGFTARNELLNVKGIERKSYEQAVGFLRINNPPLVEDENAGEENARTSPPIIEIDNNDNYDLGLTKEKEDSSVLKAETDYLPSSIEAQELTEQPKLFGFTPRFRPQTVRPPSVVAAKAKKTTTDTGLWTPLERTSIHPESYADALSLLNEVGLSPNDIGSGKVGSISDDAWMKAAQNLMIPGTFSDETVLSAWTPIIEALKQPKQDVSAQDGSKTDCFSDIQSINDLKAGLKVSGMVIACSPRFGAFVDIGVCEDGLIPRYAMTGRTVEVGSRIVGKVLMIDQKKKRIVMGLEP